MRAAAPPIALVLHLGLLLLARQHTGVDAAVESPAASSPAPGDDGLHVAHLIINSIFDSNTIPQNQEGKTVELIVYLYTGITGVGPGQVAGNSDNELLPVPSPLNRSLDH